MESVNIILIIIGTIVTLIGIAALISPNFAKLINAPGGPRLKALVSLVVGLIILTYGIISQI